MRFQRLPPNRADSPTEAFAKSLGLRLPGHGHREQIRRPADCSAVTSGPPRRRCQSYRKGIASSVRQRRVGQRLRGGHTTSCSRCDSWRASSSRKASCGRQSLGGIAGGGVGALDHDGRRPGKPRPHQPPLNRPTSWTRPATVAVRKVSVQPAPASRSDRSDRSDALPRGQPRSRAVRRPRRPWFQTLQTRLPQPGPFPSPFAPVSRTCLTEAGPWASHPAPEAPPAAHRPHRPRHRITSTAEHRPAFRSDR